MGASSSAALADQCRVAQTGLPIALPLAETVAEA